MTQSIEGRVKIATLEDAFLIRADYWAYGVAFVDEDGKRADPREVIGWFGGGYSAGGTPVFRPEPVNIREAVPA